MFAEYVAHNLCCQIRADDNSSTCIFTTEKSVTFIGACANEIIPSINRSFVYKAKEGRYVRIGIQLIFKMMVNNLTNNHLRCFKNNIFLKQRTLLVFEIINLGPDILTSFSWKLAIIFSVSIFRIFKQWFLKSMEFSVFICER